MLDFLQVLLNSHTFIPHGHCYLWKPGLVGLHVVADSLIALAYFSIPLALLYFIHERRDVPFNGILLLFSAFIVSCGTTHLFEVWTLWHPAYWLSGLSKAITAFVSLYAAITLVALIPKALEFPNLAATNQALAAEIAERQKTETALRESEARFQAFMNNSPTASWITDELGQLVYISQTYSQVFQIPADYVPQKTDLTLYPSELRQQYLQNIQQVVQTRQVIQAIELAPTHDGTIGQFLVYKLGGVAIDITDRIRAEQALQRLNQELEARIEQRTTALRESQAQLLVTTSLQQAILDGTDYSIISTNPHGIIQTFNAAAQKMLGYAASDVVGRVTPALIHDPEEIQQQADRLSTELNTTISPNFAVFVAQAQHDTTNEAEWTYIRKDGSRFPVSLSITALRDAADQVIGFLGIAKDITQQKQLEAQARKNAAHLAAAQRIAQLGSWEFDLQTQEIIWSEEVFHLFGRDLAAGNPTFTEVQQAIHPDDRVQHAQTVQQAIATQQSYEIEFRIYHTDGELHYLQGRGEPVLNAEGTLVRLVGTILNITDRKYNEAALQTLSNRLTLALKSGAIGTWDWDTIHEAEWDDRMYELYGLQQLQRAATYQDWVNLIHPGDRANSEAALQEAIQGTREFDIEFRIIRPDGALRFIKASALVQWNPQGQPTRMVGINYDITERKQTEAQLRQTNEQLAQTNVELARATRLKDEFLANMSHELRTPLNAILGLSEGLQDQVFGPLNARQIKVLGTIEDSGRHLLELINDILDLSKIESGKLELHFGPVPIRSLCDASLAFVKEMALKKNIQISTQIPDDLSAIRADDRRLRQVLINLLSNAVKFTPTSGSIHLEVYSEPFVPVDYASIPASLLSLSPPTHSLCFAITDTGIGIAPEDIGKLFQTFVQIDSSLNRQYAGTGLGLALVKRIVTLHGGTIAVKSALGEGSCFTVSIPYVINKKVAQSETSMPLFTSLPLENHSVAITTGSVSAADQIARYLSDFGMKPQPNSQPPLILLVEDNQANTDTISCYLETRGYRLILATNGQEAIDLVQSQLPDLILMDIQMPGMDGLEAIQHIRANGQAQVPIIALTALAMSGDREKCLAAGATEYLTKPIKLKQLAVTIQHLLLPRSEMLP
jgi:PAS domain S-box-containing protein